MGSPRVDLVFRLGQCDKENQGWCEGPPLDRCLLKFRSAGRAFTLRQSQSRTKKEYCFASVAASPSFHSGHWPVIFGNPEVILFYGSPQWTLGGVSFPLPASCLRTPSKGKLTPFSCPDAFAPGRNIAKHLATREDLSIAGPFGSEPIRRSEDASRKDSHWKSSLVAERSRCKVATNVYPRPGTVAMKQFSPGLSPNILLSKDIC